MDDAEPHCRSFVQTWAEAVISQVKQVRQLRLDAARRGRAYERMDGHGPDILDLQKDARTLWAEEHKLVWAAHQAERWVRRLAIERGEEPPPRDKVLADLRNALEHLDEAEFDGHNAVPGSAKDSLARLPDGRISIATGHGRAFGLIDVEELERRALAIVQGIEDEFIQEAESWWIEMNSGR